MPRGGQREGAGRPKGVGARRKQLAAFMDRGKAKKNPLQYLIEVLNDEKETPARRMEAAAIAIPYLHVKLHSIDVHTPTRCDPLGLPILDLSPIPSQGPRVTQLI